MNDMVQEEKRKREREGGSRGESCRREDKIIQILEDFWRSGSRAGKG